MIYIRKKPCSKKLRDSINSVKRLDDWKSATDENTSLLRQCFDLLDKDEIKRTLIEEQHGICAYCMARIKEDSMTIEHWQPLSKGKKYALDYKNFAGCCCGGRPKGSNNELCCDAAKEDKAITISPWNKEHMDKIKYTTEGRVVFDGENPEIFKDINYTLKLNGELDSEGNMLHDTWTRLVENRRRQYRKFSEIMHRMNGNKYSQERIVAELKKCIKNLESQEEYEEYVGVLLYFMRRKVGLTTSR